VPLTLDQVFVGQWHSLFQLPQNSNPPSMRLNTPHFQTSTPMNWAQMNLLFKHGAGYKNDNCVSMKLAKNTCVALSWVYHKAL